MAKGPKSMRFGRLSVAILFLLSTFLLTGSALADSTVSMTLIGPGGNNGGGVYTYPYNFSINGGPSTPLICDAFDNDVISGESWKATVSGLLSGNGMFGNDPLDYKAAGLIFQGILGHTIDPTVGNWAIWGLFSSTAKNNPYFLSSGAALLDSKILITASSASASQFAGLVLYTPVNGTQTWGGTPQEYIGFVQVPEPGELSLLLTTALFGLAGFVFRKRLGLKPVVRFE